MSAEDEHAGVSQTKRKFLSEVRERRERHERSVREGDQSFWSTVGMMGAVGWSVALPAAAGALFGRWLDGATGGGHVFVTANEGPKTEVDIETRGWDYQVKQFMGRIG